MAGQDLKNILRGVPAVYIKAYDEANDPIDGNTVDWTGFSRLGFQGDGGSTIQLNTTGEIDKVMVGEYGTALAAFSNLEGAEVGVKLAEGTPDQLQYVIPGSTYTAGATPGTNPNTLGMGGGALPLYTLAWQVDRVTDETLKTVVFCLWKVFPTHGLSLPFGRATAGEYDHTFEALRDLTRTAAHQILQITALTNAVA